MTVYTGYVRERFEPFAVKQVRAAEPYRAEIESSFINNTNAAWYQMSPARKSWAWPDPTTAPGAVITAFNTSTNFNVCPLASSPPRCLWTPGWYVGDAVIGIKIMVVIARQSASTRRPLIFRSFVREMTGISSTEYGAGSPTVLQNEWYPWQVGRWRLPGATDSPTGWTAQKVTHSIIFTSLPAGRDIKVRFTVTETGPVDSFSTNLAGSGSLQLKFAAMTFEDIMERPGSGL